MSVAPEVRCSPAPVREPRPASRVALPSEGPVDGQAPLSLLLPAGRPGPSGASRAGERAPVTRVDDAPDGAHDRTGIYPEPGAWAARFVLAVLEVSHGVRPADQLVRWTSPEVHASIARRAELASRVRPTVPAALISGHLRVLGTRSCMPATGICEVSAVVADRGRIRAIALRLEGLGNRWRVTALQIG